MTCADARPLLNAYFDAELDAPRRAAMAQHMSQCAQCAGELDRLSALRERIRSLTYSRAPQHLHDNVRDAVRAAAYLDQPPSRANWRLWGAVAAGIAIFALAFVPFLLNTRRERQLLARDLISAHARAMMGHPIDVISTDRHTVKPWLSSKLPFSPPVTDLTAEGFPLEGGRVDFTAGRAVAAIVYRRRLHRIDLFVWPASTAQTPAQLSLDGFNNIVWTKDGFTFAAVSDLSFAELSNFQQLLRNPNSK